MLKVIISENSACITRPDWLLLLFVVAVDRVTLDFVIWMYRNYTGNIITLLSITVLTTEVRLKVDILKLNSLIG